MHRLRRTLLAIYRQLLAQYRFLAMLLREFWATLLVFVGLVSGCGLLLSKHYTIAGRQLSLVEGIYAAFTLVFFQTSYPFPREWDLQLIFFLVPILGLALVAEGLGRFLSMVINHENRLEDWHMALASTYSNHIIVCGIGRIGYRILQQLHRTGEDVVAIEKNRENLFVKDARAMGFPVVIADPTREEVLQTVNVQKARTIIIATDDDLANLEIALDARDLNPGIRVVLRMFNDQLVTKIKKAFNIQVAFSTSALAGPVFASASVSRAIKQSFYVEDQLLEVAEYRVLEKSRLAGKSLEELKKDHQIEIIAVRRGTNQQVFPKSNEKLAVGDVLVVLTNLETVKRLEEANGGI